MPTLAEIMAGNPGVKAEVEALVRAQYNKGEKDGSDKIKARIKSVENYVGKTEYPEAITNLAIDVLKGEKESAVLEGAVIAIDAINQQAKSSAAQAENKKDTPPETNHTDVTGDGTINTEADYQAEIAKAGG